MSLNEDVKLYPHQQRVVDKDGNSVIVAHSVGSGKTLTGIARFEHLKDQGKANKALVVVPSSLRNNFGEQGVGKFTNSNYQLIGNKMERHKGGMYGDVNPDATYNILSYDMFRKNPEQYLTQSGADTLITDEAHKGKNEGTATTKALKMSTDSVKNYIGLTGSLVSNTLSDVQPLYEVASGGSTALGRNKEEFEKQFLRRSNAKEYRGLHEKRRPVTGFKHEDEMMRELSKYVDYVDYDDIKDLAKMPGKDINVHRVTMSKEQAKYYKQLLRDDPAMARLVTKKRFETLRDDEAAMAFNKMIEARKLMNSVGSVVPGVSLKESANITPKTNALLNGVQNHLAETPDGQAIILSHLINGGMDVVEAGLKERHIPYGKFLGKGNKDVTEESRQQDVIDYNSGKKRVMLVSSAGGEGLSLNNTTFEGVLDPHYNPEKMNQMEARGVRSGGLAHRPEDERIVQINRYLATMPKTFGLFKSPYATPDEMIYEIAQNKARQNQMLYDKLKQAQRQQSKEANTMELGLIKVAEEKKEEKKNNAGIIGAAIGAKVGGSAGAYAMKDKADKAGLNKARKETWDKGIKGIADAVGPDKKMAKNIEMNEKLTSNGLLRAEKSYKGTRNKYILGGFGAGTLAGAASGFLTGKGVEKVKEDKKK